MTILEPGNISPATWRHYWENPFLLVLPSRPAVGCQCRGHFLLENHKAPMWHLEKLERLPWLQALTLVETLASLLSGESSFILVFYWLTKLKQFVPWSLWSWSIKSQQFMFACKGFQVLGSENVYDGTRMWWFQFTQPCSLMASGTHLFPQRALTPPPDNVRNT